MNTHQSSSITNYELKITNCQSSIVNYQLIKRFLAVCAVFFGLTVNMVAQDREFWFAAPDPSESWYIPTFFMMTNVSDAPADVTMTFENGGSLVTHTRTIAVGGYWKFDITTAAGAAQVENPRSLAGTNARYGIHITSTQKITAYYMIASTDSRDIFTLKGKSALGRDFYVPMQSDNYLQTGGGYPGACDQVDIVASEDNTTVNVMPTTAIRVNGVSWPANSLLTVPLNRGETLKIMEQTINSLPSLTGTHIWADKDIAVTIIEDLVGGDTSGDQIVPVSSLGTTYVVAKGYMTTTNGDRLYLVATQAGTNIDINGTRVASNLNAGATYVYVFPSANVAATIQANYPIYVYQRTGYNEQGSALLPSLFSFNQNRIDFYVTNAVYEKIFLIYRTGEESGFTFTRDGTTSALNVGTPTAVPNITGWSVARPDLPAGSSDKVVTISNPQSVFSLGYIAANVGAGTMTCYGNFTTFGNEMEFSSDTILYCEGSPPVLDGGYALSYDWVLPDGTHSSASTVQVTQQGLYRLTVNYDPAVSTDSIYVFERLFDARIVSSSPNADHGDGTRTYSVDFGWQNTRNIAFLWKIDGVAQGTSPTLTHTWNWTDNALVSVELTDTITGCTKTATYRHIPFPDNVSGADCYITPTAMSWDIREVSMCTELIHNYGPLTVGDIDGDGNVEVIAYSDTVGVQVGGTAFPSAGIKIFRYNSSTNQLEFNRAFSFSPAMTNGSATFGSMAIARYNNRGYIVVMDQYGYLFAYDENGVHLWKSDHVVYQNSVIRLTIVNIADFNGDGIPEVYSGNKIFSLVDGKLICDGGAANNVGRLSIAYPSYSTHAVDIDGDGILELCAGTQIYKVNIAAKTMTVIADMELTQTLPANAYKDGATQVVDIDNDGKFEIVVVSETSNTSPNVVYVWKPLPGGQSYIMGSFAAKAGNLFSIPMIGNIDNTEYPEIVFISRVPEMYALKFEPNNAQGNQIVQKWILDHYDYSDCTGMSLFDFNLDGINEIVYRDEQKLRIISGNYSGGGTLPAVNILATFTNVTSGTLREFPVIADIDGDGQAEIMVTGHLSGWAQSGYVRVFKSNGSPWAPARKVWNQYAYNAVNVNEDLTIPAVQLSPLTVFPGIDGLYGTADDVRPYNNFMQQQTILNRDGTPLWLAPDALPDESLTVTDVSGNSLSVTVGIINYGDAALGSPVYVTFYRDSISAASKIATVDSTIQINAGDTGYVTLTVPDVTDFNAVRPFTRIVARINDNGTTFPYQAECDTLVSDITLLNPAINRYMQKHATLNGVPHDGRYANPVSVLYSENIEYKIAVVNANLETGDVSIIDTLPPYLTYVEGSADRTSGSVTFSDIGTTPQQKVLEWTSHRSPLAKDTVSYEATPVSSAVASQPFFINHAWVTVSDTVFVRTNSTYHQGAGVSVVTFSASAGGCLYNTEPQALDYRTSPRAGVLILPDSGYVFAGWSHDEYISLKGEKIDADSGIMHYGDIVVYGNVELRANFVPEGQKPVDNGIVEKPLEETGDNVWASGGDLYIRTKKGAIARIYTSDGILRREFTVTDDGTTTVRLDRGVYIVTLNGGAGYKVIL